MSQAGTGRQQLSVSPLQGVLLAILLGESEEPMHGYKLATLVQRRLGPAWGITRQSVYAALERLERNGLAASAWRTAADRDGLEDAPRRRQKLWAPAGEAEAARDAWMASALSRDPARGDLQARLAVSRVEDAPKLLRALDAYERDCFAALRETSESEVPMGSWFGLTLNLARMSVDGGLKAELQWIVYARRMIADFLGEMAGERSA